jgi:tetratricopeptide (TPR) repeat protein
MKSRFLILVAFFPLLLSCQSNNVSLPTHTELSTNLLLDNRFSVPTTFHIETEEEIFRLDDAMLSMVNKKLVNNHTARHKARVLLKHIFNEEHISLKYNSNANVTASQAYHSQTANCMSLTIMAYALAHEAGINVSFQQVNVPEYWVRNGQYNMLTGHVNLVVREHAEVERNIVWGESSTQIDFDPYVAKEHFSKKIIKKNTVLAMFYNNKGAEALIEKDYSIAYQYFREAIKQDESFSSAWGNLGILYRFTEHYQLAEKVYRHALILKKDNLTALTNLSLLLKNQNREDEAQRIEDYLHQMRKLNPYYYALLADEAFYQEDYSKAAKYYKKAIKLDGKRHEFYFGLTKVYYKQNKIIAAKHSMKKAIQLNTVRSINQQYIAKLNFLKQPDLQLN